MQLQIGENRVGISWESLTWFLIFTAVGTVIGAVAYQYLQPYLPLPAAPPDASIGNGVTLDPDGNVLAPPAPSPSSTSSLGFMRNYGKARRKTV
jgi:hypothetical protein